MHGCVNRRLSYPALPNERKIPLFLVAQTLADKPPIVLDRKLYSEQRAMIAHAIQALDADHDTVMIIGHNPALNDYLHDLGMTKDNLPTSGLRSFIIRSSIGSRQVSAMHNFVF